jgi:hypothetical protein
MPKSSGVIIAPAPKGWKPNPDEAADIANDKQLQRMSRDEQYHFFKNRRGGSTGSSTSASAAKPRQPQQQNTNPSFFGRISKVLDNANAKAKKGY